jgi:hypothetical protein
MQHAFIADDWGADPTHKNLRRCRLPVQLAVCFLQDGTPKKTNKFNKDQEQPRIDWDALTVDMVLKGYNPGKQMNPVRS